MTLEGRSQKAMLVNTDRIPYKAMGQPICSLATMARPTVYTTQQGVQGIYCAVSVVLALGLWVLLMYYR